MYKRQVYQFVLWLKMPSEDMKLFSAIVVAIFLAIPYLKEDVYKRQDRSVEHIHKEIVKRTREPFYLVGGQI